MQFIQITNNKEIDMTSLILINDNIVKNSDEI